MSNHLYTRAGGIWTSLSNLLASEMADLDAKTVDSISGSGGAYVLSEGLIIGGAADTFLQLTVPFTFEDGGEVVGNLDVFGNIYTNGTTSLDGALVANGIATFNDNVTFNDGALFNGNVGMSGSVLIGNSPADSALVVATLDVLNPATFESDLGVGGSLDVDGVLSSNGDFYVSGVTHFNRRVHLNSGGYIEKRTYTISSDAGFGTVSPADYDEVLVLDGFTPSIGATLTIDDAGLTSGAAMSVVTKNTAGAFFLSISTGGTIALMLNTAGGSGTGTHMRAVEARKGASGWFAFNADPA